MVAASPIKSPHPSSQSPKKTASLLLGPWFLFRWGLFFFFFFFQFAVVLLILPFHLSASVWVLPAAPACSCCLASFQCRSPCRWLCGDGVPRLPLRLSSARRRLLRPPPARVFWLDKPSHKGPRDSGPIGPAGSHALADGSRFGTIGRSGLRSDQVRLLPLHSQTRCAPCFLLLSVTTGPAQAPPALHMLLTAATSWTHGSCPSGCRGKRGMVRYSDQDHSRILSVEVPLPAAPRTEPGARIFTASTHGAYRDETKLNTLHIPRGTPVFGGRGGPSTAPKGRCW